MEKSKKILFRKHKNNQLKKSISKIFNINILPDKKSLISYRISFVLLLMYFFFGLSNEKKIKLRNLDSDSVLKITVKGSGSQKIISSSLVSQLTEVSLDHTPQDINYAITLSDNYFHEVILTFDSPITSCSKMFENAVSIITIDLSNLDLSCSNSNSMFIGCNNLESINFGDFDTSSITDMSHMFEYCYKLEYLDLSKFNTYKVTNMLYMFRECKSLLSLDLSKFETSSVQKMNDMFCRCEKITSINLSNFNTSSVETMLNMFNGCSELTSLDLSSFNTIKVKTFQAMFRDCSMLEYLDLSNFEVSSSTDFSMMFFNCISLTSINLSSFNTKKATNFDRMFCGCQNLLSLDLSNFNTSSVTSMAYLFNQCYKLSSLDISSFNTEKCTNMRNMFSDCKSLETIDLSNFNTHSVNNLQYMFSGCKNLLSLDLSNFSTNLVTKMDNMFNGCESLIYSNIGSFDFTQVGNFENIFYQINIQSILCLDENINNILLLKELNKTSININCDDSCFILENPKIIPDKNKCIDKCKNDPDYQYEYNNICYKTCPLCTQISSNEEKLCEVKEDCKDKCENYQFKNICFENIEEGYYLQDQVNNILGKCNRNCKTCNEESTTTSTNCNSCFEGKSLINGNCEQIRNEESEISTEPSESSSTEPSENNSSEQSESSSEQSENSITEQSESSSEQSESSINEQSESSNTEQSESSTTEQPESSNTEQSESSSTEQSESSSTEQSESSITEQSESSSTEQSESSNTEQSESSNTEPSESSSIEQSESSSIEPSESITTESTGSSSTEPSETSSTEQPENSSTEQSESSTEQSESSTEPSEGHNEETNSKITTQDKETDSIINCRAEDLFLFKSCGEEVTSTSNKDQLIANIEYDIMNKKIDDLLENITKTKEDLIVQEKDTIYQITTTENQNNNEYNNISTVKIGDCEDRLKEVYGINKNLSLIIFKIDYYSPDLLIPIIGYEIFHPENKSKLDLNHCKDILIELNIPVSIDEDNLFKYDPNSEYYADECIPSKSENGTDIILNDRQNEYNTNNYSLCQNNCTFTGYDPDTKKAICDCEIKTKVNLISEIMDDPNKLSTTNFTSNDGSYSNIITMKCVYTLFTKEGLKSNIGSYILILIILSFGVSSILFYKVGYALLENDIKLIIFEKGKVDNDKNNMNIYNYEQKRKGKKKKTKKGKNLRKSAKIRKKKDINFPPKRPSIISSNNSKQNESIPQSKLQLKDVQVVINLKKKKSFKKKTNKFSKFRNSVSYIDKNKIIKEEPLIEIDVLQLNDFELNTLEYKEALIYDKRTCFQIYISLLKVKQLILFAFVPIKDYNTMIVKINIFFLSFAIFYAVNALFFNEKTIHKIYEDGGSYNFIYFLPQIMLAFIISYILSLVIKNIFVSEKNIIEIKREKQLNKSKVKVDKVKRCIVIKYIIFYVVSIAFLIFFWYYLSSFGAVYKNTQVILIKNTLISFSLCLLFPFIINIVPSIFRKISLNNTNFNGLFLFKISRYLQYI